MPNRRARRRKRRRGRRGRLAKRRSLEGRPIRARTAPGEGGVPENGDSVDQKAERALGLIAERPELFVRQGAVVATYRWYKGRRLGPYWRLAYREAGRQRSIYLGRMGEGVERVRQALARRRDARRWRRTYRRLCRRVKASLRAHLARFDQQLRALGLRRKGIQLYGDWDRAIEHLRALRPLPDAAREPRSSPDVAWEPG